LNFFCGNERRAKIASFDLYARMLQPSWQAPAAMKIAGWLLHACCMLAGCLMQSGILLPYAARYRGFPMDGFWPDAHEELSQPAREMKMCLSFNLADIFLQPTSETETPQPCF
jgi:hypothetical protein